MFSAARRGLAVAAGTVLASSALVFAVASSSPAATSARPAARSAPSLPVLVDCANHARIQPKQIVLACADGNDLLSKMSWSHWGAQALGTGSEVINDCTPTCVGGTFHSFPVITVLWRPEPRAHHTGQLSFTRATIIYTGKVPAGLHRTRTVPLVG
jgi:hypothetical protein